MKVIFYLSLPLIGYDIEKYREEDEMYENLHYYCRYERKPEK